LKEPTESTHTVHIKVDGNLPGGDGGTDVSIPGFAKGGQVRTFAKGGEVGTRFTTAPMRQALQRFAAGGAVLPRAAWTVPGTGNADTVPAALQPGSFVLRKAAANMYGDARLMKLAVQSLPRFASGGFFGDVQSGTPSSVRFADDISPPDLPSDSKKKRQQILDYVFDVAAAAVVDDFFYWKQNLRLMNDAKASYDSAPTDAHLESMLQYARNIGLNLGQSKGTHTGFDVDGRRWHKQLARPGTIPAGLFGPLTFEYSFFNQGGGVGTDTVNALLTPGEVVINRDAARAVGYGVLEQLNSMRVPRSFVREVIAPMPQVRTPARFAGGGVVGIDGKAGWPSSSVRDAPSPITVNFHIDGSDLLSEDQVRRKVIPVINDVLRRSGQKVGK
jgi:hypothetical protein